MSSSRDDYFQNALFLFNKEDWYNALINFQKALSFDLRAFKDEPHYNLLLDYYSIGLCFKKLEQLNESMDSFLKAQSGGEKLHKTSEVEEILALLYVALGNAFYFLENMFAAVEYFQQALILNNRLYPGRMDREFANIYHNLGNALKNVGDLKGAEEALRQAIKIDLLYAYDGVSPDLVSDYRILGLVYRRKENYERALEYQGKALDMNLKIHGPKISINLSMDYNNLGLIFSKLEDFDKAGDCYSEAIRIANICYPTGKSKDLADFYNNYGYIFFRNNDPEKALVICQKALIANCIDFNEMAFTGNPDLKSKVISKSLLFKVLSAKSNCLLNNYYKNQDQLTYLIHGSKTVTIAMEIYESILKSTQNEFDKLFLQKEFSRISQLSLIILFELYKSTGDNEYLDRAFVASERFKAFVIREMIEKYKAGRFAGVPDSVIEKINEIRDKISRIQLKIEQLYHKVNPEWSLIEQLSEHQFTLNRDLENIYSDINLHNPKFGEILALSNPAEISQVQQVLEPAEALIKYVFAGEFLFIFVITQQSACWHSKEVKSEEFKKIKDYLDLIKLSEVVDPEFKYAGISSDIYQLLISDIAGELAGMSSLVIIPDDILMLLPFETIFPQEVFEESDLLKVRYLIEDFDLSYHLSATLWLSGRNYNKVTQTIKPGSFLGFAPVFEDELSPILIVPGYEFKFSPLHESLTEINSIASLFKVHAFDTLIESEDQATKVQFLNNCKRFNFIHLITHGFYNKENPALSGIAFYPAKSTKTGFFFQDQSDEVNPEDVFLFNAEAYNLDLDCDLLCLSACETGLGGHVKGEGILALIRGFLYSGARAIIQTMWQVSDKSTSELMIAFYKNLIGVKDSNIPKAIQQAKIHMIKNSRYSHPYYWAPFTLIQ